MDEWSNFTADGVTLSVVGGWWKNSWEISENINPALRWISKKTGGGLSVSVYVYNQHDHHSFSFLSAPPQYRLGSSSAAAASTPRLSEEPHCLLSHKERLYFAGVTHLLEVHITPCDSNRRPTNSKARLSGDL